MLCTKLPGVHVGRFDPDAFIQPITPQRRHAWPRPTDESPDMTSLAEQRYVGYVASSGIPAVGPYAV
jgi:hypothetical protein